MAEGMIITPVIEKSLAFIFTHTYQELQYVWKFKTNTRSLENAMDSLEALRATIDLNIVAAKNNAHTISPDVEKWLDNVEKMKTEVEEIVNDSKNAEMGCCFNCKCPNLKVRYTLSKTAATKTTEIADLVRKGESLQSLPVGHPKPLGERPFTSPLDVFGFESRRQAEKHVLQALLDEKIHLLAVCGMGGVGKTTMVKKIADEMKKKNHFDDVVMSVVSQNYDPINVQQQLAEKLGIEIKETTPEARAERLHSRLMDQDKKILLIIDDIWEDIKLGDIGIPSKVDRKGLKVLLTSRDSRVFPKMGIEEIIEVGVLTEEEAWGLFKKHANISGDSSDVLGDYPKKVAKRCQGLPLAIEVIGKTLKGRKQLSEWRDALHQLENAQDSGTSKEVQHKVYSSIAWSVNYLEREHESLLLLCSLFPEDYEIEIEDLVRYAKGLQLFNSVEKMTQTRDRVESICIVLKECYLLIACDDYHVKLHDMVRDTCLRIASMGDNVYMVSHSGLTEWPDKDTYESYTAISMSFDHLDELPSGLKCSRLQLMRLSFTWRRDEILKNLTSFLQMMEKLSVVNINNCRIELPPQSLQTTLSLRTLNLHNCIFVGDLSALLESLLNVEVLSFFKSWYEGKWPKQIAKLSNLRSLDLRFRGGPRETFPTGILIHLKKLEELYLGEYLDMELPESHEILREIGSLSNLNTIQITDFNADDLALLLEELDTERLLRFYISPSMESFLPYQFSRSMIFEKTNIANLLELNKMKALFSKVDEYFKLDEVTGCNDLVNDFGGESVFSRLRSLELNYCEMKYLCNTTDSCTRSGVFVDLKRLVIYGAKQMEELCHGTILPGSFARLEEVRISTVPRLSSLWGPIEPPCLGNLTTIKVSFCKVLRSLFLGSSLKCFTRLRRIEVSSCAMFETLVSCEGNEEKYTVEFPELEGLHLIEAGSFKTFCSEQEAPMVLLCTTNSNISLFPKLRILKISGSLDLHIADVIKNGQNLFSLEISTCHSQEICFDFRGGEVVENAFCNLDSLTLSNLPNIRHLWRNLPEAIVAFHNLTSLSISHCQSLKQLLTLSMAKMLARLRTLNIKECWELEAIVVIDETTPSGKDSTSNGERIFEQLEHLGLWGLPQLRNFEKILPEGTVAFQKLSTLEIVRCRGLRYLFTPRIVKEFSSLKEVEIISCNHMESTIGSDEVDEDATNEVIHGAEEAIILPKLFDLTLMSLPNFRMICLQSVDISLPYWNNVYIQHCPMLKRFCAGHLIAPELKQVRFSKYKNMDLKTTRKLLEDCELGKRCISCSIYSQTRETCDHLCEESSTNKNKIGK